MSVSVGGTSITYNDSSVQGTAYTGARVQVFSSSGTFTVPAGVTAVWVQIFGGGGGGSGSITSWAGARGGAGMSYVSGLTPGASISVTVGSGGAGAAAGVTTGSSGGTSSFGSYCSATGGAGANGNPSTYNSGSYTNSSATLVRYSPSATANSQGFGFNLAGGTTTSYAMSGSLLPFGGGAEGAQGYSYGTGCCPPSTGGRGPGGGGMSGGGGTSGNTGYPNISNGAGGAVFGPGTAGNPGTNSVSGAGGGATGGAAGAGPGGGGGGGGGVIVWF